MDRTAAERQRRYRAHKAGDHTLCAPDRECRAGGVPVTSPVTPVTRHDLPDLGRSGRRLWREMSGDDTTGEVRTLTVEACRIADRLDQLDRLLRGDDDAWIRLHSANEDGSIVKVVVNQALAESRQQAVALARITAELRQARGGGKPAGKPAPTGKAVGGGVISLAAEAAKRRSEATG